jgi:cytochrome c oxidase subunit 2
MFYMIIVLALVTYILFSIIRIFNNKPFSHKYLLHGTTIEVIWTILPAVLLVFIAFPSFILLYLADEVINPSMTIKAIGYQ